MAAYHADEIVKYIHATTCDSCDSFGFEIIIGKVISSHNVSIVMYQAFQLIIVLKIVCIIAKSMMTVFPLTLIEQPLNSQIFFVMY